jgi:phenylalanyl-tRNA synthetase beta chain
MGRRQPAHFTDLKSPDLEARAAYDEWDAKRLGELAASAAFGAASIALREGDGAAAFWRVLVGDQEVGVVRSVALDAPVWAAPAFGVEITLGEVSASAVAAPGASALESAASRAAPAVTRYVPLPVTPPAEFDLALLVPDGVRAEQVEDVMRRVSGDILERAELFDLYTGPGVVAGQRSLAWRLTFRHAERTLRDKEIEARRAKILDALADELNVRQRAG